MINNSINLLYANLDDSITLAQSYTQLTNLAFIIKACRLKPNDYVFGAKVKKIILYRNWHDEFGNSFKIVNKSIDILYNDLSLDRSKINCSDIYYGLSISNIIKMSKMFYLFTSKDEDLNRDYAIFTCLGIDNFYRTYQYLYGEWSQCSTLLLGFNRLQMLAGNQKIEKMLVAGEKIETAPCQTGGAWLNLKNARNPLWEALLKQFNILES